MADLKITQLTALASPALDDLLAVVDDVAGTPTTKKATIEDVLALASGGNTTSTSAHASPPASPSAGDLWLPNNSFYAYRYSGSLWVPWGPIYPMTPPPPVSEFAWVNQGTSIAVETNGGIYLECPASASHSVRALVKTAPATPYSVVLGFLCSHHIVNFLYAGLLFRESGTQELMTHSIMSNSGSVTGYYLQSVSYADPTTGASDVDSEIMQPLSFGSVVWLAIADNGTNRIAGWSADKQNWRKAYEVVRTSHLTADQFGIFVNSINASWKASMTVVSLEVLAEDVFA